MKYNKLILCLFSALLVLLICTSRSYASDIKDGQVVEKDKVWTITFNDEIQFDEFTESAVNVFDSENFEAEVKIKPGPDGKSILVEPPEGGYKPGKNYTLQISDGVHSNKHNLKEKVSFKFSIKGEPTEEIPGSGQVFSGWAPGNLGLAVTRDGKTAYVPFSQDDSLLVVDLKTFTVTTSIDVSAAGNQIGSGSALLTPDEKKLYVSNYGTGNVMVIDTVSKTLKCLLPLKPAGILASSMSYDGSRIYVPSEDGGLYIINTSDNTYQRIFVPGVIFGPVSPSRGNPDILYTPGIIINSELAFESKFFEFDLSTKTVKRTLSLPEDSSKYPVTSARRLMVSSDGSKAYFGRFIQGAADKGTGSFYTIDLNAFKISASQPIDKGVSDFTVSEKNNKIYILGCTGGGASSADQTVREWDISLGRIVREITVSPSSDQRVVVIDPADPGYFYMTEGDFNLLRRVEISTGKETARIKFNKDDIKPDAIIKNGNTAYVTTYSYDIYKLDLQSGELKGSIHIPFAFNGSGFYKGRIYIESGDRIRSINPIDGSIEKVYEVGRQINTLYFTFYKDKMVTIDFEQGGMVGKQLLVFDAETMTLIKTIPLQHIPYGHKVLVSPDGSKLYLESGNMWGTTTVISILDSTTFETLNTISIPPLDVRRGATGFLEGEFDETGRVLYLLGFMSVYMINMDTNKLMKTIDTIDINDVRGRTGWSISGLAGIMLSPSRDKLFVVSGDAHSMYTYDLKNSAWSSKTTNIRGYFPETSVSSPGKRYLYTSNNFSDSITMIDMESGTVKKIIYLEK